MKWWSRSWPATSVHVHSVRTNKMTESTRHLSDHLMSLHPSDGFLSPPTTFEVTIFVTQAYFRILIIFWIMVHQHQTVPLLGARQVRLLPPTLRQGGVPLTKKQSTKREKDTQGKTGRVLVGTNSVLRKIQWVWWSAFFAEFHMPLGRVFHK